MKFDDKLKLKVGFDFENSIQNNKGSSSTILSTHKGSYSFTCVAGPSVECSVLDTCQKDVCDNMQLYSTTWTMVASTVLYIIHTQAGLPIVEMATNTGT